MLEYYPESTKEGEVDRKPEGWQAEGVGKISIIIESEKSG